MKTKKQRAKTQKKTRVKRAIGHGAEHVEKHMHRLEYDQIDNFIYVGTNACCTGHFDTSLKKLGIKADISLEENRIDSPYGVSYYVWLPTKDHHAPPLRELLFGVYSLDYFVKSGIKTYVHCKEGHTRAPTLIAAYYIYKGMPVEWAVQFVKQKRPSSHITPQQVNALKAFDKFLRPHV